MNNNEGNNIKSKTLSNQEIIDKYKVFVSGNPTLLPNGSEFKEETIFEEIEKNYKEIVLDNPEVDKNYDRDNSITTLFTGYQPLQTYIEQETLTEPLDIILNNNPNSDLCYFFTKMLWYTLPRCFKENGNLDTSVIKTQVDKDLNRADMTINGKNIERSEFLTPLNVDSATDYFNLMLMDAINNQNIPILMNTIILTDLCRMQQCIQICVDMIVTILKKKGISQGGEAGKQSKSLTYNIIVNDSEQSIECIFLSPTFQMNNEGDILIGGSLGCYFKANIIDLSYTFRVYINPPKPEEMKLALEFPSKQGKIEQTQNYLRNVGTNALEYTKENPGTVAAATGVSSVLAAGVGTLLAAGILGGKTKKRLNKNKTKRYNNKTSKTSKTSKTKRHNKRLIKNKTKNKRYNKRTNK